MYPYVYYQLLKTPYMYADEQLPEDAIEYYDLSDVSIEETSSMDTEERDRKKTHELYKRSDPDYYYYKTQKFDENGDVTVQKVQIYSSPLQGKIRNATTGIRESVYVGSRDEAQFFRVKDAALYTKTDIYTDTRKLFYRNPEECERHLNIKIPSSVKSEWHRKNL